MTGSTDDVDWYGGSMNFLVQAEAEYQQHLIDQERRHTMSNTMQETLTVEQITQYGIKSGGKNYSISPLLGKNGVTPQSFQLGSQIVAEIWTGPKGGKSINKFTPANGSNGQVIAPPPMPPQYQSVPMPPSLPQTTVAATPAPGGVAPVQKTAPAVAPKAADDKMSKAEWADRNREISIQAVVKSSLESPALGEHVTGKSTPEFMQLTREFIKFNLETYRMALEGKL